MVKEFDVFLVSYESYLGMMVLNYEFLIVDYDYFGMMFELGSGMGKFGCLFYEY